MYNLTLTEEEMAIILNALGIFQYYCPFTNNEQFDIATNIMTKIDNLL